MSEPRHRRPPGVSLALAAVALLYGIRPLLEAALYYRLDATADEALIPGGIEVSVWSGFEGVFGGVMLALCVLTWRGRPARMRWALIGAMLALTGVNLVRISQAWGAPVDPVFGGQVQSALRNALLCQLPLMVVVPLYVTWYLNRAPARAYFAQAAAPRASGTPPAPASHAGDSPPQPTPH